MDKNELLPCPFCGGEAKQYTDRCVSAESGERFIGSFVVCSDCPALVGGKTEEEAVAAWNRRKGPTFVTPDAALKVAVASDPVVSNPPMGGGRA